MQKKQRDVYVSESNHICDTPEEAVSWDLFDLLEDALAARDDESCTASQLSVISDVLVEQKDRVLAFLQQLQPLTTPSKKGRKSK